MLVKFAIDPQALHEDSQPHPFEFEDLVEKWENFGILVNSDELQEHIDSFESNIGDQLRKILEESDRFKRCRFIEETGERVDWSSFLEDDGRGIHKLGDWADALELAVIDELLAAEIGIGKGGAPLTGNARQSLCGLVEPIGLAIAVGALVWRRAWVTTQRPFLEGELHDALWERRFRRLVEFSSEIVIIDAFALHDRQFDGFVKFLRYVDRDGSSCRVTLYSSPDKERAERNADRAVQDVRRKLTAEVDRFARGGLKQVTVRLLRVIDQEHDRYVRFNHNVYAPQNSIALVFCGSSGRVEEQVGCAMKPTIKAHDDGELFNSDDEMDYDPFEDELKPIENALLEKAKNLEWLATEKDYFILPRNQGED